MFKHFPLPQFSAPTSCVWLVLCFAVLPLSAAVSQNSAMKLIQEVPENSAWTVRIVRSGKVPDDPDQPIPDEVDEASVREGELRRESHEYSNGIHKIVQTFHNSDPRTIYITSHAVFHEHPRTGESQISGPQDALMLGLPYSANRFHGFHWISQKNFAGEEIFRGVPCNVYRQTLFDGPRGVFDVPEDFPMDDPGLGTRHGADDEQDLDPKILKAMRNTILRTAYVDRKTLLPVALKNTSGLQIYEFHRLTSPLSLPEKHLRKSQELAELHKREMNRYRIPQ